MIEIFWTVVFLSAARHWWTTLIFYSDLFPIFQSQIKYQDMAVSQAVISDGHSVVA